MFGGGLTGALVDRYGGSIGKAPFAITVSAATLFVVGVAIGLCCAPGSSARRVVWLWGLVALAGCEVVTLATSGAHSVVGDALVLGLLAIPTSLGAALGVVLTSRAWPRKPA